MKKVEYSDSDKEVAVLARYYFKVYKECCAELSKRGYGQPYADGTKLFWIKRSEVKI